MKRTNSEKNDRRRSWDKTTILTALRARRDRGLEMSARAVRRSDSGLETAIRRHFISFREALRAANIEWVPPPKHCIWDKSKIVAALRDRRSNGLEMHLRAVRASDVRLSSGIRYHFGSFDAALRAAGIDPGATRRRLIWDKDRVVAELRSRRERGLDLSTGAIQKSQPRLAGAIFRHFRYHDQALLAAGIDPAAARHAITWDKSMVLVELRRRHAAGEPLSSRLLYQQAANLYGAAWRLFGSYRAALCAAGIDPEQIKAPWPVVWPTERILAGIREHYDRWWSVHPRNEPPKPRLDGADPLLASAARHRFGSMGAALRAAGIDDPTYRPPHRWTADEVLTAVRDAAKDGRLSHRAAAAADRRLPSAAQRHFGSLRAAAEAAGMEYVLAPRGHGFDAGHWTEGTVLKSLRDLHREGHDLRYRPMKTHSQPLFFAAKQLFGSYVNAVRQAGIDVAASAC